MRKRERGRGERTEVKQAGCILWINIKEIHVISAIRNLRKDRFSKPQASIHTHRSGVAFDHVFL